MVAEGADQGNLVFPEHRVEAQLHLEAPVLPQGTGSEFWMALQASRMAEPAAFFSVCRVPSITMGEKPASLGWVFSLTRSMSAA